MRRQQSKKRGLSNTSAVALIILIGVLILLGMFAIVRLVFPAASPKQPARTTAAVIYETDPETPEPPTEPPTEFVPAVTYPLAGEETVRLDDAIGAQYALLIDADGGRVLAQKNASVRMYPASMTKLMTLIVAIENIDDLTRTFTMTEEILQPLYEADASCAGFQPGETVTVMDLLYGAALPSGADATTGLAILAAGSEEAFVGLMNEKVEELGLKNTHFMNASGLHDEDHYSTAIDMALILEYCLRDDLCRRVISTAVYTTTATEQHPDGITIYDTMFNKMYGTEVEGITILGGKTGYTDEAGQCLASYAETPDGHCYIAVTSFGHGKYQPVYDAFKLYGLVTGTYPMYDETDAAEAA